MRPSVQFDGSTQDGEDFFRGCMRAATALREAGLGTGEVVAVMLRNEPAMLRVEEAAGAVPANLPPHRPHRAELPQWVPQVRLAAPAQERVIRGTASG